MLMRLNVLCIMGQSLQSLTLVERLHIALYSYCGMYTHTLYCTLLEQMT